MLNSLQTLLRNHYPDCEKTISEIDKSCCSSSVMVWDFDVIKDRLKIAGTPKSADCLLIDDSLNVLYFIEMKDFDKIFQFHTENHLENDELAKFLLGKFAGLNIQDKIVDSHALILGLLGYHQQDPNIFLTYLSKEKTPLHFIILVKLDYQKFETLRLATAEIIQSNLHFRFLKKLTLIEQNFFEEQFSQ